MSLIMLGLLGFSLVLFILSFFQKDSVASLKDELEQFTMQQVQENYQMKKKINILEEELLMDEDNFNMATIYAQNEPTTKKEIHDIIKNQVWALATQGKPIEQIAGQASISVKDVYDILKEYTNRGKNNG
ncbi:MAG: hypothetical protein Q8906_04090 [Bacillota bacterium]|nr:hypothetical protein [Bacillota bacterium]MDP4169767.1 hypothetical protein [Bacillota bacterium]